MSKNREEKRSYASVANNRLNFEKKLLVIPTEIDDNGTEVVVFDEVLIKEGCEKWDKTLCGYFVGENMSVNELRYNLRRMWGRHGFKDIVDVCNGVYYMKFFREE